MKIAVVEDSDLAREGLVAMLASYQDLELVFSAENMDEAQVALSKTEVDVLFLDIHMPGGSGFELLVNLNCSPLIVFTTAYSEYAIRSFDFNTVDYLLKPIGRQRLDQAIVKLRRHYAALTNASPSPDASGCAREDPVLQTLEPNSRLLIRDNEKCHLVELASILYFESCKNEARAFFDGYRTFIKRSMNELEQRLPPRIFFRANRQYIINLQAVKSIEESVSVGFSLVMSDGKRIEISRRRTAQLTEMLKL